jgi:hypothetical protein
MRSRNYTKEIGVSSTERPVPAAVAFAILALVAVAALVFIRHVLAYQPAHEEVAATPAAVKVSSR